MKKKVKINSIKPKLLDFILLAIILASAIFFLLKINSTNADYILVSTDYEKFTYPLNKDATYQVQGKLGITSFEVKDNNVRITDSPCPNKTCISMGYSNIIVCLPNGVMIEKISNENKVPKKIDSKESKNKSKKNIHKNENEFEVLDAISK